MKTKENFIGELVADDYRTSAVFEKYGIDFCCNGNITISEVCEKNGIDKKLLLEDLDKIKQAETDNILNYNSWPLDLLVDYIEKKHHRYVEEKTPVIKKYLEKICSVHGGAHPELFQIKDLFNHSAVELAAHMKKEELVLFPFIRKMIIVKDVQFESSAHFGTIQNPINKMRHEHDTEGNIFREISELSNDYCPPADACNTYKITFDLLREFEKDLHLHIHLENNILFPKSIEFEQSIVK